MYLVVKKRFLATVLPIPQCRQLCAGGGLGVGSCRRWDWTSKERVAMGNHSPKVLVLGRRWDSLCLAEAGGQDKAVVWVRVAHELLPAAVVPGPSVMGSGGWYCHPTGQHPSGSIEREVSMVLMGNVPLLPRQCPAL